MVEDGLTLWLPLVATLLPLIVQDVALELDQVKVVLSPGAMVEDEGVKEFMVTGEA